MEHCYNCGCELTKDKETREHIPMRALFKGYPKDYLTEPVTVPACSACNNEYSKIEEDFRNLIAIWSINEKVDVSSSVLQKALRSPKLHSKIKKSQDFNITFNIQDYIDVHIKKFKGLYYHQYGISLPSTYEINVLEDLSNKNNVSQRLSLLLKVMRERIKSEDLLSIGHKDIFQYKIVDLGFAIMCDMVYFKRLNTCVCAIKKAGSSPAI